MTAWFKKKHMPLPPPPEPLSMDTLPELEEKVMPPSDFDPIQASSMAPIELPREHFEEKPMETPQKIQEPKVATPNTTYSEKGIYETILQDMKEMDSTLKQSQSILEELNEVKVAADTHLEEWRMTLEDVERKLLYIDNVLFEK